LKTFFFGDVLQDYQNGARLELRAKLAIEFAKLLFSRLDVIECFKPAQLASFALETADQLVEQSVERGLVAHMPETGDLSADAKRHFKRMGQAGVLQQLEGQRFAETERNPIVGGRN
jgi:hypothetical protein